MKETQSDTLARGDSGLPLGLKLSVSGSTKGSSESGTAWGSCTKRARGYEPSHKSSKFLPHQELPVTGRHIAHVVPDIHK